ncbi:MAG: cobalamin B12-binding domain-containing protein [Thermoanaerobaculia bacterium]
MDDDAIRTANLLDERREEVTDRVLELDYARVPELMDRYGARGREFYRRDNNYHVLYLEQAVRTASPELFVAYLGWAKSMLHAYNVRPEDLKRNLETLEEAVREIVPAPDAATQILAEALARFDALPLEQESFIATAGGLSGLAKAYLDALLGGHRQLAGKLVLEAVRSGTNVRGVYLDVFQATQREVGRLWQSNKINVAQEHYCTAATQLIMAQLYPWVFAAERKGRSMVATCVSGDLHELGIRMVADFMEMDGWDSVYLGASTPAGSVLEMVEANHAEVLAISATISYHVRQVGELIRAAREREGTRNTKIIVGGYPFLVADGLWKEVGADGWAPDAAGVSDMIGGLVGLGPGA